MKKQLYILLFLLLPVFLFSQSGRMDMMNEQPGDYLIEINEGKICVQDDYYGEREVRVKEVLIDAKNIYSVITTLEARWTFHIDKNGNIAKVVVDGEGMDTITYYNSNG